MYIFKFLIDCEIRPLAYCNLIEVIEINSTASCHTGSCLRLCLCNILLEVFKAFTGGIHGSLLPLLLFDNEVFRAGLFMRGFKDGSPIDSVVRIAYDASVNVAVTFSSP